MCQAIPRRVLQVDGERVEIDLDGRPTWIHAVLLPELQVGEYVLVYAGQAVEQLSAEEAEELLQFYGDLERTLEAALD